MIGFLFAFTTAILYAANTIVIRRAVLKVTNASIGLLSFGANLTRYIALSLGPASVITPLVATSPVFLLVFSFVFNRNLEIFNTTVIAGTIAVVAGTILIV